ncbi:MAG: [protein-PII] uridylyltransferase [Nitrospira sp.]|nr:[protein-PII] uridylyltransferase [Candidatus Manganitrophaceae bacterium]HIL35568.1 [protein-PII] uridylyltransferase [Candidatus Manganitrophaceae bacterium]
MEQTQSKVLAELQKVFDGKYQEIRSYHHQGGGGSQTGEALTNLADSIVLKAVHFIDPGLAEEWNGALIAIGGYGRAELSPGSDIDLMFLCPVEDRKEAEPLASELLCLLWDLGYKVGHSFRTTEECIDLARQDQVIGNSLLESRRLLGNRPLFKSFREQFFLKVVDKNLKVFLHHLESERDTRHAKFGPTPFLIEPNLKESPGGLRDVHFLKWVASARYRTDNLPQIHQWGHLSNIEYTSLKTAHDFLWKVRNHLHFMDGKASDYLAIDLQEEIAPFFNFKDRREFMRRYYIETGRIFEISKRFAREASPVSRYQKLRRAWNTRVLTPGFQLISGEISIQSPKPFHFLEEDSNILRLFLYAKEFSARIADPLLEVISQISEKKQETPLSSDAIPLFRELLSKPGDIALTLRIMHRTRLLWRIIPEFSRVHCLVQESPSHAFTVDEHSIRALEEAEGLLDEKGLLHEVYIGLRKKDILHLALLLHDIGKGKGKDHSRVGAEIAEEAATLLGYGGEEKDLLIFLVRRHLIFSEVALYRDFSNEPVLLEFTREVSSPDTLRNLFILTVADIRAVGPGRWTSWKGDLLSKLYREALVLLAGKEKESKQKKVESTRALIPGSAKGEFPVAWLEEILPQLPPRYLLKTPIEKILIDLSSLKQLNADPVRIDARALPSRGVTEYTLYTYRKISRGIFSKITGVLTAKGLKILAAQVYTLPNGMIIDTFQVVDPDYPGLFPGDRSSGILEEIKKVLRGDEKVEVLLSKNNRFQRKKRPVPLPQPVRVELDNHSSQTYTVIDLYAPDRRGLLYVISKSIFDAGLTICAAKIATRLDQVVDIFYVTDSDEKKLTDPEKIKSIRTFLKDQIEANLSSEKN